MTTTPLVDLDTLVPAWRAAVDASQGILAGVTTEAHNQRALALTETLLDHVRERPELGPLLDVLSYRIETFEKRAYPIPRSTPARTLASLMEAHDLTSAALADATGLEAAQIDALLASDEGWTRAHMLTLAAQFHISPTVFL